MEKILKTSLLLCFPFLLSAQLKLNNNGAIIKVNTGTDVRVNNGSIENQNSGSISNNGKIYLDATFNQTTGATYTSGAASWLWFEGVANQNITSDASMNIARLRVDNGNKLVLGNNLNVSTDVDLMNNGNIELGSFNLNVASGGTIANYNATNYIMTNGIGHLQQEVAGTAIFFPIGNSSYNPVTLTNLGTTDNFQARVEDQVRKDYPSGVVATEGVVNRAWLINEETVGGSLVSMTVQWAAGEELSNFDRTISGVSHWNGTTWDRAAAWTNAVAVGADWSQTRMGITSFSPFIVEDTDTDLPIELLSFDAIRLNQDQVQLDWATASELNNKGFYVERLLANENIFEAIAFVDGKGTTSNTSYYNLQDDNSYSGVSYYRLKQVDDDGTFSYSPVRAVAGVGRANTFGATIFPNPVEEVLKVRFDELPTGVEQANVKIIGINGQILQNFNTKIQAYQLLELDFVRNLVPASYVLVVTLDNGEQVLEKFVKN